MNFSDQTTTPLSSLANLPPANTIERRTRKSRSAGHVLLFFIAFIAGLLVTLVALFGYILFFAGPSHPLASSSSSTAGAILIQTKTTYMTELVQKNLNAAGLPGQVTNAQVSFTQNGPMVITGNIQLGILGITTTRHLTVSLQPYIGSCQLHLHVLQADLQGLSITTFVQSFEGQINDQLQIKAAGLPAGFNYCLTNVHTDPTGLSLTYSATPT